MHDFLEKLSDKQQAAVLALMSGSTRKEAAKAAQIDASTLWRWLQNDENFKRALRESRKFVFETELNSIFALSDLANETLKRLMKCGNPAVEARAVAIQKTFLYRAKDLEILERLERLESQLSQQK